MPKFKQPTVRHALVAKGLLDGMSMTQACMDAGYSRMTASRKGAKICGSPEVVAALREIGRFIKPEHLDEVARAKLMELLTSPGTDARSLVVAVRLALEIAGRVGAGRVQEHDHLHHFSPETQERIAQRLAAIMERKQQVQAPEPATAD